MTTTTAVTTALAEWAASTPAPTPDSDVAHHVRRMILDHVACAALGSTASDVQHREQVGGDPPWV